MANKTQQGSSNVHGANPQFIIDHILRQKIYQSTYWKAELFAVSAETLVDKAIALEFIGGTYGGMRKPSKFLCLLLKMLQIAPDKEIVYTFIQNEDYKYATALGLFYLRLIGKPEEIYQCLETYYIDNRKLRFKNQDGKYSLIHMDEFVDFLIREETYFDILLPHLPKRWILEEQGLLQQRKSALEEDLDKELVEEEKRQLEKQELEKQEQEKQEKQKQEKQEEEEEAKQKKEEQETKHKHRHKHHQIRSNSNENKANQRESKHWRKVMKKNEKNKRDIQKDDQPKQEKLQPKEPEEGSVEYWNKIRANLGMKLLPTN